jgi:hypothetical protein
MGTFRIFFKKVPDEPRNIFDALFRKWQFQDNKNFEVLPWSPKYAAIFLLKTNEGTIRENIYFILVRMFWILKFCSEKKFLQISNCILTLGFLKLA